ncbi:hypothetical protein EGH25_03895 [Haladaptatus sp. F3-133]|uniref:Uncharacterized protein n=1 Tax=Halorutilus salinus TaxID=2487751 RepID=A0A9Q4GIQ0_9EURY|nr:hypothetical protein [Halorutilus salinus]MCX2818496.1 hypothetical protein [Halorutilus salinus]
MPDRQQSARNQLKRNVAVFGVALIGAIVLVHFALPFDMVQLLLSIPPLAIEYPKAVALLVFVPIVFYAMATVDDYFR